MDHCQVQAREKSEPLWQLAKVHESKQDENQAITVLSTKRVNESRRTTQTVRQQILDLAKIYINTALPLFQIHSLTKNFHCIKTRLA